MSHAHRSRAAARPSGDLARLSGNLWKLYVVRLLFSLHFVSAVLIPFYRDWGGLSYATILFVNGWLMFWNFLLEVPTGAVADVWSRKASLGLGCLAGAVGCLVYVSTPQLWVFLVAEVIYAAAMTLLSGADEALVYDSLQALGREEDAQRSYSRLAAAQRVGLTVGAVLGGPIAVHWGLRAPLLLDTLPLLVAAGLTLTLVEAPQGDPGSATPEDRDEASGWGAQLRVGWRAFWSSPELRRLTWDRNLGWAIAFLIIWFYQPSLEKVGVSIVFFGVVHAGLSLGQALFLGSLPAWVRLTGSQRNLLRLAPALMAVLFPLLAFSEWAVASVLAILVIGSFGLARPPLFSSHLNRHIRSRERATVLSIVNMLQRLATAAIYVVVGPLADRSLSAMFLLLGVLALLLLALSPVRQADLEPARTAR